MKLTDALKPLDDKKFDMFHIKSLLTTGMGVFTDGVWASLNFHEFVSNSQPLGFNGVTGKPVTPPPL